MPRACSQNERTKEFFNSLANKLIGDRPLGRPSHRWEENISVDSKVINEELE